MDFACPYNGRVDTKELEKTEHCQCLAQKLRKIRNMKVNTPSDRYPRNSTHKVKKVVKGNRY